MLRVNTNVGLIPMLVPIPGDRNGFNTNNVDKCGAAKVAAYKSGLNASFAALAQNLSATARGVGGTTIITNYPTHEAMALSSGGMTERGLALNDFKHWSQMKCGLDQGPCLLAFHTDHGTGAAFIPTLYQACVPRYFPSEPTFSVV